MLCTPYRTECLADENRSSFLRLSFEIAMLQYLPLTRCQSGQRMHQHHMSNRRDVARMVPGIAIGILSPDSFSRALDHPFLFPT